MANFKIAHDFAKIRGVKYRSADFETAQGLVQIAEGGYQNDPSDAGNWTGGKIGSGTQVGTNYGISAPTLKSYLGRDITANDMQNLDYDTAKQIYKSNYWNKINGDDINDQSVTNILYDSAVNQGLGSAIKFVNIPLNTNYKTFTSDTTNAINSADPETLFAGIKTARGNLYDANSGSKFYSSWMNRLNSFIYSGEQSIKQTGQDIQSTVTGNMTVTAFVKKNPFLVFGVILFAGMLVSASVYYYKKRHQATIN